jgi:hypothetical protein
MDENEPREVGARILEVSYGVLTENLGREPEPAEFCEMAETMVADLLTSGYVELRNYRGAEAAEKWLKKVLSMVSAGVRASGSDAFIHIDLSIKDVPNRIVRKAPEAPKDAPPAAPPPPAPVCACVRTKGRCVPCRDILEMKVRHVYGAIQSLNGFKESDGLCPACCVTEFDHAIARALPDFWKFGDHLDGVEKAGFARDLIGVLAMAAAFRGINEIPVTVEAWTKLVKDSGIEMSTEA